MLSFDRLEHPPKDRPAIYPPSSARLILFFAENLVSAGYRHLRDTPHLLRGTFLARKEIALTVLS
jgi:hypothetical protein